MSVYTAINRDELEQFLANYEQGKLTDYEGILSGIENTNYFVNTDRGQFVLTIFEHHTSIEIPFFLDLTAFLSEQNIPCAHPVADKQGGFLRELKHKPAALVQRLPGKSIEIPTANHCRAVGQVLAHMHLAGQQFSQQRNNSRGQEWWLETAKALDGHIDSADAELVKDELDYQNKHSSANLPCGIIHADLFKDNVLFDHDQLSGLIDFYYACTDVLLYDVAVVINDWCTDSDGTLNESLVYPLLAAYQKIRLLTADEQSAYPIMLRAAALRFWLSRLYDLNFPREGEITHTKDPADFRRILSSHRNQILAIKNVKP